MNRLVEVIGPAPSELPPDQWMTRLRAERSRVRRELELFRIQGIPTKRKSAPRTPAKKRGVTNQQLKAMAREYNITIEEMLVILKKAEGGSE